MCQDIQTERSQSTVHQGLVHASSAVQFFASPQFFWCVCKILSLQRAEWAVPEVTDAL